MKKLVDILLKTGFQYVSVTSDRYEDVCILKYDTINFYIVLAKEEATYYLLISTNKDINIYNMAHNYQYKDDDIDNCIDYVKTFTIIKNVFRKKKISKLLTNG